MKKSTQTFLLALLVMLLWGSLFPCVKLAYKNFTIDSSNPANLLLFAGVRFLICGAIILLFCCTRKKDLKLQVFFLITRKHRTKLKSCNLQEFHFQKQIIPFIWHTAEIVNCTCINFNWFIFSFIS